ncbi:site-specific integrase [bacterium]|nr:site-specific integrase [bacterium]
MATFKIVLMEKRAKTPSEVPLYIRVTQNRKSSYISLRRTVNPKYWDHSAQRVKPGHTNATRMNAFLSRTLAQIEEVVLDNSIKGLHSSANELKAVILGKESPSFTDYAKSDINKQKREQNHSRYKKVNGIISKLNRYTGSRNLEFRDINYEFLNKYEMWLRESCGNSQNTIHCNLKYFRKLFNDAIREGLIEHSENPFLRYRLKTEKTTREYLTEDEIKSLNALDLKEDSCICQVRDLFVFACYTGIRISDLLCLRTSNYDGNHVQFQTRKTQDLVTIKVPSVATSILEKYNSETSEYLFPFIKSDLNKLELQKKIMSITAKCNQHLKVLAPKAGIQKHLHFHMSRHSFATLALKKGVRIEHVSSLLGHSSLKTTQIYTKIANNELDLAMDVFG